MTLSFILSCLFFGWLLHSCTAPKMHTPSHSYSTLSKRRYEVVAISKNDPCSRKMWVFMSEKGIQRAKRECEEAYNIFVSLIQDSQDACLNAASPACRPLSECENLFYGCTFLCDSTTLTWRPSSTPGYTEQVFEPGQEVKHLKQIVKEFMETLENRKAIAQKRKTKGGPGDQTPGSGSTPGSTSRYKRRTVDTVL